MNKRRRFKAKRRRKVKLAMRRFIDFLKLGRRAWSEICHHRLKSQ